MDTLNDGNERKLLEASHRQFSIFDHNASRHQKMTKRLIQVMLSLNVIGTVVVVATKTYNIPYEGIVKFIVILVPVASSFLYAIVNRFSPASKWTQLRSSAETIYSSIFRYRVKIGLESKKSKRMSRDADLVEHIKTISHKLMETQVNLSALHEDGVQINHRDLLHLSSKQYIRLRVDKQIEYYADRTKSLEKKFQLYYILIYFFGGLGTMLAALGHSLWVACTTSISSAFVTWLELQQIESNLIIYNQTAQELLSIKGWWEALTLEQKTKERNILKLVDLTERTLQGEHSSWLRNVRYALSDLSDLQIKKEQPVSSSPKDGD
jgi:hypothetical protein